MISIQHPYSPSERIELSAMLVLVDNVFDRLTDLDRATEHGIDYIGRSSRVLNDITQRLTVEDERNAFIEAANKRYIGD